MIAAWMLYTVAVTLLLFAGASAAEYLARAIRVPARVVWAAAILVALGLSGRALARGAKPQHEVVATQATDTLRLPMTFATIPAPSTERQSAPASRAATDQSFLIAARGEVRRVVGRLDVFSLDVARFERWNAWLVAVWIVASGVAFIWLAGSLLRLWLIERELATELVDEHPVLVSRDVGPAIFGIVRSQIVVPRWVLSLPRPERQIILAHEEQHAAALDPALLYAAAVAVALQPWNLVLWALFARLRFAIEADCDRRVLGATGDARRYGRLLVTVYERTTPSLMPSVAFVERASDLERRIHRMTRRPRLVSMASAGSVLAMLVLSTAAWTMSAPVRPTVSETLIAGPRAWPLPPVVTTGERAGPTPRLPKMGVITVLGVAPVTTIPSLKLTPSSETRLSGMHGLPTAATPSTREAPCKKRSGQLRPDVSVPGTGGIATANPTCTIDGDVVVLALDSSRVLVAWRDTADAGIQNVEYAVLTIEGGTVPPNLSWSTRAGHAEFRTSTYYFASPSPGIPAVAFGSVAGFRDIDPAALRFVVQRWVFMMRPAVTWDVLRQLPSSPRCNEPVDRPLIIIDGVTQVSHVERDRACFVVGGQIVRLLL